MSANELGYILPGGSFSNLEVSGEVDVTLKNTTFNVQEYGATGTGIKDDTAYIKEAIDAIPASGGILYFPAGTYLITSQLVINGKNVCVQGAGRNISVLTRNDSTVRILELVNATGGGVKNLTIDGNITYDPTPVGEISTHLLKLTSCTNLTVENCLIHKTFLASCVFFENCDNCQIINCDVREANNGILCDVSTRQKIINCSADTIQGDPGYAFQFKGPCFYGVMSNLIARNCSSAVALSGVGGVGGNHTISNVVADSCEIPFDLFANNFVAKNLVSHSPTLRSINMTQCTNAAVELLADNTNDAVDRIRMTDCDYCVVKLLGVTDSNGFGINLVKASGEPTGNRLIIERFEAFSAIREPFLINGGADQSLNDFHLYLRGTDTFTNDAGGAPLNVTITHDLGITPRTNQIHVTFDDDPQSHSWISNSDDNTFTVTRAASNNTASAFSWEIK